MAEIKITCPNCFNDKQCFEDKLEIGFQILYVFQLWFHK